MNIRKETIGGKDEKPIELIPFAWWKEKPEVMYESIWAVVNRIEDQQNYEQELNVRHARLYNELDLLGFANQRLQAQKAARRETLLKPSLTYNVIKSVIDTLASKIAKSKPKPQFLTDNGNYGLQERAKKLTSYVEGVFYDVNMYELAREAFISASVFGTGAIKFFIEENRIKAEKVWIDELRIDYVDGMQGKPKQMHQVKFINRQVLQELFPEKASLIASVNNGTRPTDNSVDDVVKVIESWRLPTMKGGKDGAHSICIENCTLLTEEYNKDYFPFVFIRYNKRVSGFFGEGVAEILTNIQASINKTLLNIQKAQDLVAVPRIFVQNGTNVISNHLNNNIGSIVSYTGQQPTFQTPTAMNPEVYNHLKWLIQSAFEITGVSQLSAQAKKPAGIDSGVALREYNDIESERFMLLGMEYEELFLRAAEIIIDMSKDIYSNDKNLRVKTVGRKFIETIKWSEVDLEEDQFAMKVFPVSILPSTPAGKLAKVQELIQAGLIPQEYALSLLDFPDLSEYESLELASLNLIKKQLNEIVEKGKYIPPEPFMDLAVASKIAHNTYLDCRLKEVPEERLEMLIRFADDCDRLLKLASPTPAEQGAPQMAVPEAPPTSELLPTLPMA